MTFSAIGLLATSVVWMLIAWYKSPLAGRLQSIETAGLVFGRTTAADARRQFGDDDDQF
ncbi:hypothetical protein RBH26_01355 [Natronolimnohabitans sp. A-GB9]|uniref:hypothetical protein n=1 Tax=Natronolimnohabitans sp. A-GB9 TaxID=3069757 RepID=UPI0027AE6BE4|nr:hypothetical protein [Natronolimnohabitans sp. A-GB9]MDQ2049121.1 hypothetical protein [Natronolimnohabitans sp. A-GB9]